MTVTTVSRENFLAAIQVIDEGRGVHPPQELERARAMLKPIAHYQWAQGSLLAFCFLALAALTRLVRLDWPWSADLFLCAIIGALASRTIMHISSIRHVFAPPGFEIDDVREAARHVFA